MGKRRDTSPIGESSARIEIDYRDLIDWKGDLRVTRAKLAFVAEPPANFYFRPTAIFTSTAHLHFSAALDFQHWLQPIWMIRRQKGTKNIDNEAKQVEAACIIFYRHASLVVGIA